MRYLRIVNKEIIYPYNINQLRNEFSNTSFPSDMSGIDLSVYDVHTVNQVPVPSNEDYTKIINEGVPVLVDGEYFQNWNVEEAPQDYTDTMISSKLGNQWEQIRGLRNQYLSECDWTQLSDSPLTPEKKAEWIAYRQALRDITLQSDPFNITWPIKPE